ncbi:hypothetical protein BpHYR1_016336 [Brachionus plicatilis]|uniref:Uncharacterized protein n=1 Tax=Brachionus plicatilis TaxID=10195 RepID=A0A3M7QYY8_BRAPC|nr:hypothetical protein BpHYR1_016336 [Brachionus plicatilis]
MYKTLQIRLSSNFFNFSKKKNFGKDFIPIMENKTNKHRLAIYIIKIVNMFYLHDSETLSFSTEVFFEAAAFGLAKLQVELFWLTGFAALLVELIDSLAVMAVVDKARVDEENPAADELVPSEDVGASGFFTSSTLILISVCAASTSTTSFFALSLF